MTKIELKEKIEACLNKAEMILYKVSLDKDECAELVFYEEDFYFDGVKTPYRAEDFVRVKYYLDPDDYENNYIKITFANEDYLLFGMYCGDYIARINNEIHRDEDVLKKYKTMSPVENAKPMTPKQCYEKIEECLKKAEIFAFSIPKDEDQIADVYFEDNRLIINQDVETPYFVYDIDNIKYSDGHRYDEENRVLIEFNNGERLDLLECGYYEAHINSSGGVSHRHPWMEEFFNIYALRVKAQKQGTITDAFVIVDDSLIQYNGSDKELILPEGITHIEKGVFEDASIEKVVLPSSLKVVDDHCFRSCKELTTIQFNDGLEIIGDRAFCACKKLHDVTLPKSLKQIKAFAFYETNVKEFAFVPEDCKIADDVFGS